MFTGLRRGEIVGLRWTEHVDLPNRELSIRENRTNSGEGDTKTDAGRRRVALDDRAVGALVAWQIAQGTERRRGERRTSKRARVHQRERRAPEAAVRHQALRAAPPAGRPPQDDVPRPAPPAGLPACSPQVPPLPCDVSKRVGHSSTADLPATLQPPIPSRREHEADKQRRGIPGASERRPPAHTVHAQGG